jgi:hypothetical protein
MHEGDAVSKTLGDDLEVGDLFVSPNKLAGLRYCTKDAGEIFPFKGVVYLESGALALVINTNPREFQMLQDYCLCLTAHGYVWIWAKS